jgi:hypothetical protein
VSRACAIGGAAGLAAVLTLTLAWRRRLRR